MSFNQIRQIAPYNLACSCACSSSQRFGNDLDINVTGASTRPAVGWCAARLGARRSVEGRLDEKDFNPFDYRDVGGRPVYRGAFIAVAAIDNGNGKPAAVNRRWAGNISIAIAWRLQRTANRAIMVSHAADGTRVGGKRQNSLTAYCCPTIVDFPLIDTITCRRRA